MLGRKEFRRVLQVCPHLLCQLAETDRGEVVDGETRVLRVVHWEHARKGRSQVGNLEPLDHSVHTHLLHHLLHDYLDEDSGRGRCLLFVHVDDVEYRPGDSVRGEQVTEESTNVSQFVRLVPMDRVEVLGEGLLEIVRPDPVQFTKSLSDQSVEIVIGAFLRTTLDYHVAHFDLQQLSARSRPIPVTSLTHLLALGDVDLHELVDGFFEVELEKSASLRYLGRSTHRVHDRQVDRSSQVDQVGLGHIRDTSFLGRHIVVLVVILGTALFTSRFILVIRVSQNLPLDLDISLLIVQKLRVNLEQICKLSVPLTLLPAW